MAFPGGTSRVDTIPCSFAPQYISIILIILTCIIWAYFSGKSPFQSGNSSKSSGAQQTLKKTESAPVMPIYSNPEILSELVLENVFLDSSLKVNDDVLEPVSVVISSHDVNAEIEIVVPDEGGMQQAFEESKALLQYLKLKSHSISVHKNICAVRGRGFTYQNQVYKSFKRGSMSFLEKKVQNNWLISFGDLLTLLLCFFIALITLAPRQALEAMAKSTEKSKENSSIASQAGGTLSEPPAGLSGISIADTFDKKVWKLAASSDFNRLRAERGFSEDELKSLSDLVNRSFAEEIRAYFQKTSFKGTGARLEACKSGEELSEGLTWLKAEERLHTMRRQLIDLGFPAEAVRMRNLGPHCSAMKENNAGLWLSLEMSR